MADFQVIHEHFALAIKLLHLSSINHGILITQAICDMIKRNELDVGHIVFEILATTVFKFLCFISFLALTNSS